MFEIIKCYVVYHLLPCYLNVFTVSKIHPCYMYYIYVYTHTYIYFIAFHYCKIFCWVNRSQFICLISRHVNYFPAFCYYERCCRSHICLQVHMCRSFFYVICLGTKLMGRGKCTCSLYKIVSNYFPK